MGHWIGEESLYLAGKRAVESLMATGRTFPEWIFSAPLTHYTFFIFDAIFSEEFFENLGDFLLELGGIGFTVFTLVPDPERYFFRHFGRYPMVTVLLNSSSEQYMASMFADPGGGSADAIGHNSSELLIYGGELSWCIYGNRDHEVAIFTAADQRLVDLWQRIHGQTMDVKSAIKDILEPAWSPNNVPSDTVKKLLANYA